MEYTESEQTLLRLIYHYYEKSSKGERVFEFGVICNSYNSLSYIFPNPRLLIQSLCKKAVLQNVPGRPDSYRILNLLSMKSINQFIPIDFYVNKNLQEVGKRIPLQVFASIKDQTNDPGVCAIKQVLTKLDCWSRIENISICYGTALNKDPGTIIKFKNFLYESKWCRLVSGAGKIQMVGNLFSYPSKIYGLVREKERKTNLIIIDPFTNSESGIIQPLRDLLDKLPKNSITLLFYLTRTGDDDAASSKNTLKSLATFGPNDLRRIAISVDPSSEFKRHILSQISIDFISPYSGDQPAFAEMFFGRSDVVQEIQDRPGQSFAIYGAHRSGKTSLLYRLIDKMKLENEGGTLNGKEIVLCDATLLESEDELALELSAQLGFSDVKNFKDFRIQVKRSKRYYEIIIDEIDDLISKDRNFRALDHLRSLSNSKYVRVIVAGYKELFLHISNPKFKANNFFKPIGLFELDFDSAYNLVTNPMKALGVHYKDHVLPFELLNKLPKYPVLLQYACSELVSRLGDDNTRIIQRYHMEHVLKSPNVGKKFIDEVILANLTSMGKLILLVNVDRSKFIVEDTLKTLADLMELDTKILSDQFQENLNILEKLFGLVRHKKGDTYWILFPQLLDLIKLNHNVPFLINDLKSKAISEVGSLQNL